MKKRWKTLSLLLILLLVGCAAQRSPEPAAFPTEAPNLPPGKSAESGTSLVSQADGAQTTDRLVVKTANMSVSVADPVEAMHTLIKLAESMGGYLVNSNQWNSSDASGQSYVYSSVTVRVPAERLDEIMQKIRNMAADQRTGVLSESVTGQDVTSDYVDSQSQLRNLQAAEQQLLDLLNKATDLQYTLDIFKELTDIRGQIEVLQGHIKYLEESAALSAITVNFVAEASLQPLQIGPWKPAGVAKEALQTLIKTAQDIGTALIKFVIIGLPFLVPIGLIIYFVNKGAKKRKATQEVQTVEVQHSDTPQK